MISGRRGDGVLALVLGAVAFTAYAPRTARDLGWVDSVEFALAAASFGVPHPTGYPLYLLATRIAFAAGGIAGVNLLSAVFGAAAVAVAYLTARALGVGRGGALVAALALAIHPELVRQATVAEVYTLHLVLAGLCVFLAARAGREGASRESGGRTASPGPPSAFPGPNEILLAYVLGLGLTHHLTILFTAPALLVLAWPALARRSRALRPWALAAGALLLPLGLYGVLAIRSQFDPVLDLGDPETPGRLFTHVTGRQFGYRMLSGEGYFGSELAAWARRIGKEWPVPLLALAAVGSIALLGRRERRRIAAGLGLLAAVTGAYAAAYRIPDKEPYFLPADLALALLAGAGAEVVAGWILARWPGRVVRMRPAGIPAIAIAIGLLAVGVPVLLRPPLVDRHADRSLRDLASEVLRRAPEESLVLVDDTSLAFALLHLAAEPLGPRGRTIVATYFLPLEWYARAHSALDPDLPARVVQRAAERKGLSGRALGDRLAADARALAAEVARHARARGQPVRFTFHDFDREHPSFEGLPLTDLGLVYALPPEHGLAPALPALDPEFACLAAYTSGRPLTREERSFARRLAVAANRLGIARVAASDLSGAAAEFDLAIGLDSLYVQAWLNRGLLRADYRADPAGALADWRRYLALAESERGPGGAGPEVAGVRARVAALAADSAAQSAGSAIPSAGARQP